jgi:hypothetical protein
VLDAFMEFHPEHMGGKLTEAERAVSARLLQRPANPDEVLALQDAMLALRILLRESQAKESAENEEDGQKLAKKSNGCRPP